jgi:hypothetical protein
MMAGRSAKSEGRLHLAAEHGVNGGEGATGGPEGGVVAFGTDGCIWGEPAAGRTGAESLYRVHQRRGMDEEEFVFGCHADRQGGDSRRQSVAVQSFLDGLQPFRPIGMADDPVTEAPLRAGYSHG